MKRFIVGFLVLTILIAFSGTAWSQQPPPPSKDGIERAVDSVSEAGAEKAEDILEELVYEDKDGDVGRGWPLPRK